MIIILKKIAASQLRLGMYIHEFCGPGIDHSLWKNGFLLQSEQDLRRIYDAKVIEIWINICRGVDTENLAEITLRHSTLEQQTTAVANLEEEVSRAVALCIQSKAAVKSMFADLRMGRIVETGHVAELVTLISESLQRHPHAFISLARLKTSDEYTYMHSVAVCALMIALAREMKLPPNQMQEAGVAGLMHDIGKAAIPVAILNKPGKLSEEEFETMRGHPEAGLHMLQGNPLFSPRVLDVCLHHHEKIDGSGYPHKLTGSQITLFARMGAICDVYDAVTSDRPYKSAWAPADAIHRMAAWEGHFDEKIFQAFVKCVGIYPVGSLVRLESGHLGVVSEQSESSLLTPKVNVFYSLITEGSIPPYIVNLATPPQKNRIISRECPARWGFRDIDQLWSGLSVGKSHFD